MQVETLNELMLLIQAHHQEHPDHGLDCACLYRYIAAFRRLTTSKSVDGLVQRRIDYVIRTAINNR